VQCFSLREQMDLTRQVNGLFQHFWRAAALEARLASYFRCCLKLGPDAKLAAFLQQELKARPCRRVVSFRQEQGWGRWLMMASGLLTAGSNRHLIHLTSDVGRI